MYRNITLICLLTVWLSACGGEGAADPSPEELARLQTMPAFTVDDNYEVFINTLVDQSKLIDSAEFNHSYSAIEYTSEFTIHQTMSIEQVIWGGVANVLDSRDLSSIQFELKVFEVTNGLPIDNSVVSKFVAAQALKLDELALLENVYTFNVQQENLFMLQPGTYQLSIVPASPAEFTHHWLQQNTTLPAAGGASYSSDQAQWLTTMQGRSVLIAGRCVGDCKRYQTGSDSDDVLIGDEQTNYLTGGKGNDLLVGGKGDDVYYFSVGDGSDIFTEFASEHGLEPPPAGAYNDKDTGLDVIVFGEGIEPAQLNFKRIGFNLHISVYETEDEITINDWFIDDSTKIEILKFPLMGEIDISGHGFYEEASDAVDWVAGDAESNSLYGFGANDVISGREGDDFIFGGMGDDLIIGGPGADQLDGGQGWPAGYKSMGDTVAYYDSGEGINIHLDNSEPALGGTAEGDEFYDVENVIASQFSDIVFGDGRSNVISGGTGDDTLYGGDGYDTLHGGEGSDIIYGGSNDDILNGGAGNDTLNGGERNDILKGGLGHDNLYGGDGQDLLSGGEDSDTLIAGAGNDYLLVGAGNDRLEGGPDNDIYIFSGDFGQNRVIEALDRSKSDEIVFSGYSLSDLWFKEEGSNLIISVVGTNNTVILENYHNYNVNSDSDATAIEQLNNNQRVINQLEVNTSRLNVDAIHNLTEKMAAYDEPTSVQEVPYDISALVQDLTMDVSLNDAIIFSSHLRDFILNVNEDEVASGVFRIFPLGSDRTLTYKVIEASPYGALELESQTGEYIFTPNLDFSGHAIFTLEVLDSSGLYSTATLHFQVLSVDDPGSILSEVIIDTIEETTVSVSTGFIDPDNILTDYAINAISTLGNFFFNSDGSLIFTPFNNAYGSEVITATFTDRQNRVLSSQFNINVQGINE